MNNKSRLYKYKYLKKKKISRYRCNLQVQFTYIYHSLNVVRQTGAQNIRYIENVLY